MNSITKPVSFKDIFLVFLRLGLFGFGGPAAHVAMMRQEVVEKKQWMSEQEFLDLWGAAQLIPGPNSTELAIHIGYKLKKWKGLIVAGVTFILPAFFLVLILAMLYQQFSYLSKLQAVFAGIRPVMMAIIVDALIKLRRSALKDFPLVLMACLSLWLLFLSANELLLIFGLGLGYALFFPGRLNSLLILPLGLSSSLVPLSSTNLFLYFLKIGSVLFGSGYVLLAFLQNDLVDQRLWLTQTQLMDAITVGQITPGPVFTTATFIGFVLQSYQGAVLATFGIFLPSFLFVALSAPILEKMKASLFVQKFLNAVNAISFALLMKVTFDIGRETFSSWPSFLIGPLALVILMKFKNFNSIWLIISGGILGLILGI